jgi:hypothetical protein
MRVRARIFFDPSFELFNQMFDIHKIQYAGQDNGGYPNIISVSYNR